MALLALVHRRRRTTIFFASVALLMGLLTLAEYAGAGLRIDQLLLDDWSSRPGAHPGRAPPNTAAVLVILGALLVLLAVTNQRRVRMLPVQLTCCLVAVIALEALAGHVGNSSFAVAWGTGQPMSVLAALSALALQLGIQANGWRSETGVISRMPFGAPALWCFVVALLDVVTPLDLNVGILYIPLVLFGLWFERSSVVFVFAAVATVLIAFGLFASPPGLIDFWAAATNRTLAVTAIWVMASLVYLQHQARRRWKKSDHHFALAQSIAGIGSFELLFSGMRLRGSAAFDAMHGLTGEAAHDWTSFVRHSIPPDERGAIDEMIDAARGGAQSRDLEYGFLLPDGAARIAVMHCESLFDPNGKAVGLIGVVHDMTELREVQARQADIEMQLRHTQKLEVLGMLAGGIAHDLNNTLVPITTLTPLLQEDAKPADAQVLEIIMDAARRAKELVREMLVYSRRDVAVPSGIRVDMIVRDSLRIIRAGIPTNITIVDQLEPVPEITGTKGEIYQTVLNLATNAAHAIGERAGSITIGVSCAPDDSDKPGDVRLFVADDGPGMDAATAHRIFEPFYSTKDPGHGTGLGLSIVSGIVKKHGGSILVRSEPGKGTRFDMLFPSIAAPA